MGFVKLINNQPSPFGRKVMIALREKNVPFEIEWDIPWHKDTTVAHYNPLEQLPILVADDGTIVYESSYILEWIEHRFPTPALVPANGADILEMKLFQVLSVGVMDALVRMNFEQARPEACRSSEWVARQKRKVAGGLGEISRRIGNREFAVADMFSLADIEIGAVLGHLDFLIRSIPALGEVIDDVQWRSRHPNLAGYIDRLEQRVSFREAPPQMVRIDFQSVIA